MTDRQREVQLRAAGPDRLAPQAVGAMEVILVVGGALALQRPGGGKISAGWARRIGDRVRADALVKEAAQIVAAEEEAVDDAFLAAVVEQVAAAAGE